MTIHARPGAGFSLVEVIIATAVSGVIITSIATLSIQAMQKIAGAGRMTTAVAIARSIMEDLAPLAADDLVITLQGVTPVPAATTVTSDTGVTGSVAASRWGGQVESSLHEGRATVLLDAAGPTGVPLLQAQGVRITVTVTWSNRGSTRSFVLQRVRF